MHVGRGLVLVAVLACGAPLAPIAPRPEWAAWYAEMERCAGRSGDFAAVTWHVLPGDSFPCAQAWCAGWWAAPHRITVAEGQADNWRTIAHEALHDILRDPQHGPMFDHCGVR